MLYRIVWYGMLNVAAMTMTAGGCGKEYWETLKVSEINKSQINWNPSFVTPAWPVILLPIFLGAYQLVSPGLSAISALVNKHKQCKHLWSYQFNNSRPHGLWLRVSLLSLLLPLQDDSGSFTAQSVRVSAWYHSIIIITIIGDHHCSVTPGFGLLITLSSLSSSFRVIHCSVTPGFGLLNTL